MFCGETMLTRDGAADPIVDELMLELEALVPPLVGKTCPTCNGSGCSGCSNTGVVNKGCATCSGSGSVSD